MVTLVVDSPWSMLTIDDDSPVLYLPKVHFRSVVYIAVVRLIITNV